MYGSEVKCWEFLKVSWRCGCVGGGRRGSGVGRGVDLATGLVHGALKRLRVNSNLAD